MFAQRLLQRAILAARFLGPGGHSVDHQDRLSGAFLRSTSDQSTQPVGRSQLADVG